MSIKPSGHIADEGFVTNSQDKTYQRAFGGQGADEDIVVSSARAYVAALNKMISFLSSRQRQAQAAAERSLDVPDAEAVAA